MYETLAYIGIGLNLFSMYLKGEFRLRIFSVIANLTFLLYGILTGTAPFIIGCSIAVFLHTYRLIGMRKNKNLEVHEH
jgi:hypothetical protein